MSFPESLSINAWCGEPVTGELAETAKNWGVRNQRLLLEEFLAADDPAPLRDWENDNVGWGIVLPHKEDLSPAELATANDAPEAIQKLVEARNNAPVFRYRPDLHNRKLRRHYPNGDARDLDLAASERGTGDKQIPRYLLIYGSPKDIPWTFQYVAGQSAFVGRLDLDGDALGNYVEALIDDWPDSECSPHRPVIWSVNHGHPDITWLMREAIAKPIAEKLAADSDIGPELRYLTDAQATESNLRATLGSRNPALVVSTSHGMTGPLGNAPQMLKNLGLLVDDQHQLLHPTDLLNDWEPDGAIWYAHACCSAGSDAATSYDGLVKSGSRVDDVLQAVATLGAQVAPMPRALLGAAKPLRAFIGQVEPTFDWTIRAENGQPLTSSLEKAMYNHLHKKEPDPVGLAFHEVQQHAGQLFTQLDSIKKDIVNAVAGAKPAATRTHLAAIDRQSMVILGDPTALIPSLVTNPSAPGRSPVP